MAEKSGGSGAAFNASVKLAESEGRPLTKEERLQNPALHAELARQAAAAIEAAERSVAKAKEQLKQAEANLAQAKKENG